MDGDRVARGLVGCGVLVVDRAEARTLGDRGIRRQRKGKQERSRENKPLHDDTPPPFGHAKLPRRKGVCRFRQGLTMRGFANVK